MHPQMARRGAGSSPWGRQPPPGYSGWQRPPAPRLQAHSRTSPWVIHLEHCAAGSWAVPFGGVALPTPGGVLREPGGLVRHRVVVGGPGTRLRRLPAWAPFCSGVWGCASQGPCTEATQITPRVEEVSMAVAASSDGPACHAVKVTCWGTPVGPLSGWCRRETCGLRRRGSRL